MKARLRRVLVAVAVAWLCIAAVRGIFAAWALPRLGDYEDKWREDVARVRQRAEQDTVSVPSDQAGGEHAACLYRQVLETLDTDQRATLLSRKDVIVDAASAGRVELPNGNQNAASICAVLSETIETTSPTGSCDWDIEELVKGHPGEDHDSVTLARVGAGCLVIEGNNLLAAGDVQAAYRRYVQTLRIRADLRGGEIFMYISGLGIAGMGVDRLAELMSSSYASTVAPYFPMELPGLAPTLGELVAVVEVERLMGWERASAYETPEVFGDHDGWSRLVWRGLALLVTRKAIGAYFLTSRREHVFRALAEAVAIEDPREAADRLQEAVESAHQVPHPLVGAEVSLWPKFRISHDDLLARIRLVLAAAKLEELKVETGSYPLDGSAIGLPVDPFAWPRTIQYEALSEGQGYRLWSVGEDLIDDHGRARDRKDLMLERMSQ